MFFKQMAKKNFFQKKIQKRSRVIPNPVNPNLPRPYEGKREKRFVTAVRLEPQKNIKMAIDAFRNVVKKHQDYIFEIYGERLYNDLQEYINELSLSNSVFLMGRTDELYERIRKASGFVLSLRLRRNK